MPSSFRIDRSLPPPSRYRTPSPPTNAFEPLSPISGERGASIEALGFGLRWADNTGSYNGRKRPRSTYGGLYEQDNRRKATSEGAMEAFASIALATKAAAPHDSSRSPATMSAAEYQTQRVAKKARSEKLPSPEWSRRISEADTRPATSYQPTPEERRREAELLLHFTQQAAILTTPSPVLSKISLAHVRSSSEISAQASNFSEVHYVSEHPIHPDGVEEGIEKPSLGLHEAPSTVQMNESSNEQPAGFKLGSLGITAPKQLAGVNSVEEVADNEIGEKLREQDSRSTQEPTIQVDGEPVQEPREGLAESYNSIDLSDANKTHHDSFGLVDAEDEPAYGADKLQEAELKASTDGVPALDDALQLMEDAIQDQDDYNMMDESNSNQGDIHENESRVIHGPLGNQAEDMKSDSCPTSKEAINDTLEVNGAPEDKSGADTSNVRENQTISTAVCAACNFTRNSLGVDTDNNSTSWISCDACKAWFHFACAGFKNERDVRSVDKFRCKKCKPIHGATTYVRKSSRAHSAIDYASLHQGAIKTSDERPEHHYIKPIKDGTITFLPENFARMRPEMVTAEYFEKGTGMKEPVVIPACLNPQQRNCTASSTRDAPSNLDETQSNYSLDHDLENEWMYSNDEVENVPDYGQDALDMVIPQGLTVRQVAELYGPEEKVEVIDVKSQNGENKKWNMRRWADYYENPNNKVVRNVISLEVSQSRLGRLIKRPKIVRDLDLQDSVWPPDLLAKGEYPRVQFYCLMSVADCFTDFHIDFGGSSVFYHILKGKKTFLFIPPKEKNLKKYEEWCMSPAQNWTFLGDQTKECYRVDLHEGDTMLIPAGWIHAVWTPEDSLVIGGNFLTRMNFGMQLRVSQVEKATGVARKFRYPHFQRLHWYTALRYLEEDPLPNSVKDLLHSGEIFNRETPAYLDFDTWGQNSCAGSQNYHARYYSQSELDGLPELVHYLLRTALIDIGNITDGITTEIRNAVKKAIPRSHGFGEPLDVIKSFAAWCAWKRGNESLPHWAYPDAVLENISPDKLSAAAMKKLDREAALSAPRRQSARMQSQQGNVQPPKALSEDAATASTGSNLFSRLGVGNLSEQVSNLPTQGEIDGGLSETPKRPRMPTGAGSGSHRKTACESCRKRRRACKHKDQVAMATLTPEKSSSAETLVTPQSTLPMAKLNAMDGNSVENNGSMTDRAQLTSDNLLAVPPPPSLYSHAPFEQFSEPMYHPDDFASRLKNLSQDVVAAFPKVDIRTATPQMQGHNNLSGNSLLVRPRTKACSDCRKSKRRCIHDEFGNEDPVKVRESAIPRPHARKSNILAKAASSGLPAKKPVTVKQTTSFNSPTGDFGVEGDSSQMTEATRRPAPIANMIAPPQAPAYNLGNHEFRTSPLPNAYLQATAELALPLLDPALFENIIDSFENRQQPSSMTEPSHNQEQDIIPDDAKLSEWVEGQRKPAAIPAESTSTRREQSLRETRESSTITLENFALAPDGVAAGAKIEAEAGETYAQPAASLVSPPASLHNDTGNSPTADVDWTRSRTSSRQSSRQQKQMQQQRYTPESGPMRRASSSSYSGNNTAEHGEPQPLQESAITIGTSPIERANHAGPTSENIADEESLRLIKEIQAQEYGLRRRGKA